MHSFSQTTQQEDLGCITDSLIHISHTTYLFECKHFLLNNAIVLTYVRQTLFSSMLSYIHVGYACSR